MKALPALILCLVALTGCAATAVTTTAVTTAAVATKTVAKTGVRASRLALRTTGRVVGRETCQPRQNRGCADDD